MVVGITAELIATLETPLLFLQPFSKVVEALTAPLVQQVVRAAHTQGMEVAMEAPLAMAAAAPGGILGLVEQAAPLATQALLALAVEVAVAAMVAVAASAFMA